jgi:hypothetical protein
MPPRAGVCLKIDPVGSADTTRVSKSKFEVVAVVVNGKVGTDVVAKMCKVV